MTLALVLPAGTEPAPESWLDGRALQQALVNLIDNALKHSPAGDTVTVTLEWTGEAETAPAVPAVEASYAARCGQTAPGFLLSVGDHGPGIPAEEHRRIFERFYRRGSELRRETQGVGIGLSIVKHIVAAHGGGVIVESAPGQGSRFIMRLPLKPGKAAAVERTSK